MMINRSQRTARTGVATLVSAIVVGFSCVVAAPCDKPTIARCSVGMTLDEVKSLLPALRVEVQADGTQKAIARVGNPMPQVQLIEGTLRVTFDKSGRAVSVWYRAATTQDEQQMLKAAKQLWGDSVGVHGADGVNGAGRTYWMNASWEPRCGTEPKLNVVIGGDPPETTVHLGLMRNDD